MNAPAKHITAADVSDEALAPEHLRIVKRELRDLEEQVRLHLTPEVRETRLAMRELEQTVNDRFDRLEQLLERAINP